VTSTGGKFFRERPLDFAGGDAGRELPFDFGGHAGGAGIFPVGVPARLHFQIHAGQHGVAGTRGVGGQNQPRLCVGGMRGDGREANPARQNGSNASHMD
jgi:hypothetical protein